MPKNIPSLLRGFVVLEEVAGSREAISATDIAKKLGMSKPTVHRIALQLEADGLLQREPTSKKFVPGRRAKAFSRNVLSNVSTADAFHSVLQNLAKEVGETCNCCLLDGQQIVYFDRVETNWPIRVQLPVGSHLPAHCTASGKVFLAYLSEKVRRQFILSLPMTRHTANTITDIEQLEQSLQAVRENGIGVDNEEFLQGMIAIAAPVMHSNGTFNFTLAIHAPTVRKNIESLYQYLPALQKAAARLALIDTPNAD